MNGFELKERAERPVTLHWFMSQATKEFYRSEFVKEMRGGLKDGHYTLLPSEAAKIVGDRWGVTPETVLLALSTL